MPPRIPASRLSTEETKAELVESLVGLIDRTFTSGGHGEGLHALRGMLKDLDLADLQGMVRRLGLEGPEELTEPEPEERPVASGEEMP